MRWLQESGYGSNREFRGAFAVTLHLLEAAFRFGLLLTCRRHMLIGD